MELLCFDDRARLWMLYFMRCTFQCLAICRSVVVDIARYMISLFAQHNSWEVKKTLEDSLL